MNIIAEEIAVFNSQVTAETMLRQHKQCEFNRQKHQEQILEIIDTIIWSWKANGFNAKRGPYREQRRIEGRDLLENTTYGLLVYFLTYFVSLSSVKMTAELTGQ